MLSIGIGIQILVSEVSVKSGIGPSLFNNDYN